MPGIGNCHTIQGSFYFEIPHFNCITGPIQQFNALCKTCCEGIELVPILEAPCRSLDAMTSIGNLTNLKFSGLCEVGFSQNLQLPSKPLSIIAQSLHIFQTVFKVEVGSSYSSSKVESEMSEQETRHPHQQATTNSPERRQPRKLDRTRLDQDSAHSGQKHTVLNDTETESTFPGPSEIVVDPRTEELVIEGDATRQHGETSSMQPRQPPQARRRPRKLLCTTASPPGPSASADEGLDARVNRLEQQVQNMNRRLDNTILEISRLQSATQSPRIAQFQQSRSGTSTPVLAEQYEDDVEHVPRREGEGSERRPEQQRMVSLTGNYKIPLPSALSTDDVRVIKEGVFAAGSIAREITTALRGVHSADGFPANGDGVAGVGGTETPKSPGGWARLIEGASQLVTMAAHADRVGRCGG